MMKKQIRFPFFSGLILFSLFSDYALALPKGCAVISGDAEISLVAPSVLQIQALDKAIIHYKKFNVGKGEKVRFIQPSKHSTVLNRVTGKDPSKILGSLESNGKVFLVNPNGIYFGPESTINVGSLIASTLSIKDQDFLEENYRFTLGNKASIVNEGLIHAEGSIALMADQMCNKGVIEAKAGSVVLASGEQVVLDFTGDGLLSFAVEGAIKESVIENLGTLKALDGSIALTLATAKKAISEIVNHEGILEGAAFIEEGGKIFFASESELLAKQVLAEGGELAVQGTIKGDTVHLFGRDIDLIGAQIDASSSFQGGEVLIGGEFQGKGNTPYASKVFMDSTSTIKANALEEGDGGLVVLWSKDQTVFNGLIEAKGISLGGMVETSSQGELGVLKGLVDTDSSKGVNGQWLLDPGSLHVKVGVPSCSSSGSSEEITYGDCTKDSNFYVNVDLINNASSNVVLQAQFIYIQSEVNMTSPGKTLSCIGCGDAVSNSYLYLENSITTNAGAFLVSNLTTRLNENITIDTSGTSGEGADVTIPSLESAFKEKKGLTINAGTDGDVTLNCVSGLDDDYNPSSLKITNARSVTTKRIHTQGSGGFQMPTTIPLYLTGSSGATVLISTLSSGYTGGTLTLGSIDAVSAGLVGVSILAGTTGVITIGGDIGSEFPVISCNIGSSGGEGFNLPNITTTGGDVSVNISSILEESKTVLSNGGDVSFSSTIDGTSAGSQGLIIDAGDTGVVSLKAIGSVTSLASFEVVAAESLSIASLVTKGGSISLPSESSINLIESSVIDSTDGGAAPEGAHIVLGPILTVDSYGTQNLDIEAGSEGTIECSSLGAFGQALLDLTVKGGSITQGGSCFATGSITWEGSLELSGALIASAGLDVTATSTIDGAYDLTIRAPYGSVSVGEIGGNTPLTSVKISSLKEATASNITVVGGPLSFVVTDGVIALSEGATFSAENHPIVFSSVEGDSDFTVTGSSIRQNKSVDISGDLRYLASEAIYLGGDVSALGSITWSSPVSLTSDVVATSGDFIRAKNSISGRGFDLTLEAVTEVTVLGSIGKELERLRSFRVEGLFASLNSIYTGRGGVVITPPVSLNANAVIDSISGDISFASTINGPFSLRINPGIGGVLSVGNLGLITPLEKVMIQGGSLFTPPAFITTGSGGLFISSPLELVKNTVFNTTANLIGGDIHLFSKVNAESPGNQNLFLRAGSGNITLEAPIGSDTRIGVFSIVSANDVQTDQIHATAIIQQVGFGTTEFNGSLNTNAFGGVRLNGNRFVFQGPLTTLGGGGVQISNKGDLIIGPRADMELNGSFSQKGEGKVRVGGAIQMTGVEANLAFTSQVELLSNSTWNTASGNGDVELLKGIEGPGGLTVEAGEGALSVGGTIGRIAALRSLDVTASSFVLEASKVRTSGLQKYQTPVEMVQSTVFSNQSGDITFYGKVDPSSSKVAAVFSMGGGSLRFLQPVGSSQELFSLTAFNTGALSTEEVKAGFLRGSGGLSNITLNANVDLSRSPGIFLDGGAITLDGSIDAEKLFFRSQGLIVNKNTPLPITIPGSAELGFEYLNAVGGSIGSVNSPIEMNTKKLIVLGAHPNAYLQGSPFHDSFGFVDGNVPCLVTFNEVVIRDCSVTPTPLREFNTFPKYWFYLPGIYSSWDNLSNDEYFLEEATYPAKSPRERAFFWQKPLFKKRSVQVH